MDGVEKSRPGLQRINPYQNKGTPMGYGPMAHTSRSTVLIFKMVT